MPQRRGRARRLLCLLPQHYFGLRELARARSAIKIKNDALALPTISRLTLTSGRTAAPCAVAQ